MGNYERNFVKYSKSLESIATEFKAQNSYREEMKQNMEQMEKIILDIQSDPFGLKHLKDKALSEKASKQKGLASFIFLANLKPIFYPAR
ncbi:hypothetical protein [Streptococcus agalactiae]|uniref:hypothetical protein n=1 Tax=Streptococcus agalactiae TaxID=1311 RepID=UPI002115AA1F|nr:hypothetical protein [Streptococcus agalactiae]